MIEQLPALQVVIPLVASPVCVLLRGARLAYLWALSIAWLTFGISLALLARVLEHGPLSYAMGGWAAPWGIEYRLDILGAFVLLLVSGVGAVVLAWAPRSLADEIPESRRYLFLTCYLLSLTGLLGICITGDLFNVFVFLEISSLSSYAMISMGRHRQALTAAFRYLIMGTIGATFILIGIGLMYMMTGTLGMADMAVRVREVAATRTILAAFGFLTVGIGLKMAFFPLHAWLPNAYAYAPSAVTAFLAATATKVSVYILLRFTFSVFGASYAFQTAQIGRILLVLALVGIFAMSLVAIFQRNIKRMLAYSSVAQVGYMVVGIAFASVDGLTGGIVHMFNHGLTKGGMFLAMGAIVLRVGGADLDRLSGIGRRMPWTTFAWVLGGLGLIGIPGTAGFVSKWYLISAALQSQLWPVAAALLISSLLAVVYVWRVVEVAYFGAPPGDGEKCEAPATMLAGTWLLIGASIAFGVYGRWTASVARRAAESLLGVGP